MDRHTDLFFSEEDAARFAKGRIFLGEKLSDASKLALDIYDNEPPKLTHVATILPTAEQYQHIREQEERNELHRSRTEGESYVTVDSLPFVFDESSTDHDRVGCLNKDKESNDKINADTHEKNDSRNTSFENNFIIYPAEGGENEREGGASDELISTSDEAEKCDRKDQNRKTCHGEDAKQTIALEKRKHKSWLKRKSDEQGKSGMSNKTNSYDLYSDQSEEDGGDSCDEGISDELISPEVRSREIDDPPKSGVETSEHCISKEKNIYGLYSKEYEEDGGDSSEEEISDELISSDGESDLECNAENKESLRTSNAKPMQATDSDKIKSNSLITSSEAIASSIIKSVPNDSGWHNRRSESEVVLSRIRSKQHRSLLKRQKRRRITAAATANSPEDDTSRQRRGGEVVQERSRTTLRFAAAPVAVYKRKKQMTLKSMFKKK